MKTSNAIFRVTRSLSSKSGFMLGAVMLLAAGGTPTEAAVESWYSGPVTAVNLTPYTLTRVVVWPLYANGTNGDGAGVSPIEPGQW